MNELSRLTDEELWLTYAAAAMAIHLENRNENFTDVEFAVLCAGCAEHVADYLLRQHRARFPSDASE